MRTFVALELPGEFLAGLKEALRPLQERHPGFRWTGEGNLHITLCFLGELDEPGAALLGEAAAKTAREGREIPMETGKIFTLPRGRPANVLALGIGEGKTGIAALALGLEKNLMVLGAQGNYPFRRPETRPFRPHITLARKGGVPLGLSPGEGKAFPPLRGTLTRLGVFRSDLGRDGPVYTPLLECPLGG
jgi:2'-5' RNA ligase